MTAEPKHRIAPRLTNAARSLRKESTFPERLLWGELRGGRLNGLRFRRQHVIGPFVVDFYCADKGLVVEVDGESHIGQADADRAREDAIRAEGCTIIRFTNDEVMQSKDAVLEAILRACGEHAG